MKSACKMCKEAIYGRSDKLFCSNHCKNEYHIRLRQVTREATRKTDIILHRNRSILLEIMGKNAYQKKISKIILDRKKFNFTYLTSYHINSNGKIVHHVYDFSWMVFSDEEVLIRRKYQNRTQ